MCKAYKEADTNLEGNSTCQTAHLAIVKHPQVSTCHVFPESIKITPNPFHAKCPIGHVSEINATSCEKCNSGSTTVKPGLHCVWIVNRVFFVDFVCEECARDTYTASKSNYMQILPMDIML